MAVLLYYPRVNPPTEILQQALLYWDGIATVVPHDPHDYAAAVQPELTQLRDRGLYTPLFFMRQVMDVLDGPGRREGLNSRVLLEEIQRMAEGPDRPRLPSPPEAYLYRSKFSEWVEAVLRHYGLAEDTPDDRRYAVPKEVQQMVVGVLAREWGTPCRPPTSPTLTARTHMSGLFAPLTNSGCPPSGQSSAVSSRSPPPARLPPMSLSSASGSRMSGSA